MATKKTQRALTHIQTLATSLLQRFKQTWCSLRTVQNLFGSFQSAFSHCSHALMAPAAMGQASNAPCSFETFSARFAFLVLAPCATSHDFCCLCPTNYRIACKAETSQIAEGTHHCATLESYFFKKWSWMHCLLVKHVILEFGTHQASFGSSGGHTIL